MSGSWSCRRVFVQGLGFRGLGFRGLGFRGLRFRFRGSADVCDTAFIFIPLPGSPNCIVFAFGIGFDPVEGFVYEISGKLHAARILLLL